MLDCNWEINGDVTWNEIDAVVKAFKGKVLEDLEEYGVTSYLANVGGKVWLMIKREEGEDSIICYDTTEEAEEAWRDIKNANEEKTY